MNRPSYSGPQKREGLVYTEEYRELDRKFYERFGDGLPSIELPDDETIEGLREKVERCFAEGRDMMDELYGLDEFYKSGKIL